MYRTSRTSLRFTHGILRNTMATAHTIQITPENTGLWHVRQTEPAAKRVSDLLQKDFETHHCFFNKSGFHNHISHHLLALYGIGASESDIQKGYDDNASYQRPMMKTHEQPEEELQDWEKAKAKAGKEQYYPDFLAFFESEIDKKGWQNVLQEYMFAGTERADDMLRRMMAGFVHPLIQLMYGVEWSQPAIIAMALAQASVHDDNLRDFLMPAEEQAAAATTTTPMPRIADLLDQVRANEKLAGAARTDDANKVRDGVLARARDEALALAAQVKVRPEELHERTLEMYNTAVYMGAAAAAAARPGKDAKFDFFLMHHINVCPLFAVLNAQAWLSAPNKVRLLEWKIRYDLIQYAARGCPPLSVDRIAAYVPRAAGPAIDLLPRIRAMEDDGHVSKLFRAVGVCRDASGKYGDAQWLRTQGEKLWDTVLHMVVDGAETPGPKWVRGAGHADAWKEVQDRQTDKQQQQQHL
ncbi:HypA protein [Xylariomycetidae sp. FL0641]|nr:HypA protein [Xylariomycetidae sp. FL0641]